jgi:large subunit ribosomal protein L14
MVQNSTMLFAGDNTGARNILCLKVFPGYRRRYANITDSILVSIKSVRSKRRETLRVLKGKVRRAIVLRVRGLTKSRSGDSISWLGKPTAVLLSKQNKIIATRIFGLLSKNFRYTKYLKILTICAGILIF